MQAGAELPGDALGERHVAVRPVAGLGAVEADRPEHLVAELDGSGEHGARPERSEKLPSLVVEPGVRLRIGDRDGAALADGQGRNRQADGVVAERFDALGMPLGPRDGGVGRPEAEEAAGRSHRAPRLLDRQLHRVLQPSLRAQAQRDGRDEALPVERLLELDLLARPVERERTLGAERREQGELLARERALALRLAGDEDCDDPAAGDDRDERRARGACQRREPRAHDRRRRHVVDGERRAHEDGARDSRRLVVEVDDEAPDPVQVPPFRAAEQPVGPEAVLGDHHEEGERDVDDARGLVQQHPSDRFRLAHPQERARDLRRPREVGLCPVVDRIAAAPSPPQPPDCSRTSEHRLGCGSHRSSLMIERPQRERAQFPARIPGAPTLQR